jgi:hypothetical protein
MDNSFYHKTEILRKLRRIRLSLESCVRQFIGSLAPLLVGAGLGKRLVHKTDNTYINSLNVCYRCFSCSPLTKGGWGGLCVASKKEIDIIQNPPLRMLVGQGRVLQHNLS